MTDVVTPLPLRHWHDGDPVDQILMLREVDRRQKRDGGPFLRLVLSDRSGSVPGVLWQDTPCEAGGPVRVIGRVADHPRYGRQVTVTELAAPGGETIPWEQLIDEPTRSVAELTADLGALIASIADDALRALLGRLLDETYRRAPAAKFHHHAYRHGLLDHSVGMARLADAAASIFDGVDRDLVIAGALLHDIGKLEAYDAAIAGAELTDAGRLEGEIPLGYYRIRRAIEEMPGFPPQMAQALLHVILAHHGRLEYGSPVTPASREATVVHAVDELSGRLGAFDRLEKGLGESQSWSRWDRVLDGPAWFGQR